MPYTTAAKNMKPDPTSVLKEKHNEMGGIARLEYKEKELTFDLCSSFHEQLQQ